METGSARAAYHRTPRHEMRRILHHLARMTRRRHRHLPHPQSPQRHRLRTELLRRHRQHRPPRHGTGRRRRRTGTHRRRPRLEGGTSRRTRSLTTTPDRSRRSRLDTATRRSLRRLQHHPLHKRPPRLQTPNTIQKHRLLLTPPHRRRRTRHRVLHHARCLTPNTHTQEGTPTRGGVPHRVEGVPGSALENPCRHRRSRSSSRRPVPTSERPRTVATSHGC